MRRFAAGQAGRIFRRGPLSLRRYARGLLAACGKHHLLTYAAAIAFQGLVALVPLALLSLELLAAAGRKDTWTDAVYPPIEHRLRAPLAHAIDDAALRILARADVAVIVFAALLALWYLAAAMRAVTEALDLIHDVRERRRWTVRGGLSAGLGAAAGIGLVASVLIVSVAPRAAGGGFLHVLLGIGRWVVAVALLALVVGLLVRYAPAERPQTSWASEGTALIIAVWVGASLLFRWYVASVANFRTPAGQLTIVLVVTGYLFTTSLIFLLGAQLDELLRKEREGSASERSSRRRRGGRRR